ncbi:MAG: hypothetical protein CMH29_00245 [Micavibrio sp.]|nr:hypothetical protein [Micavibrio sp.]|tara:strand:- start:726 stop:1049 length:324 start_codon:yes stop_codon:yes gene_type:complete
MNTEHIPTEKLLSLSEQTRCCIFSNAKGDVVLLHEGPTQAPVQWIEYVASTKGFNLVIDKGTVQSLGTEINEQMHNNLLKCKKVILICIENKEPVSKHDVAMVLKDY